MKIVYIVPYFLPSVGGIITHVFDLARALISDGYDVEIYASAAYPQHSPNSINKSRAKFEEVIVHYEKEYFPFLIRQIRNVHIPPDADVIHIHNYDRILADVSIFKSILNNKPVLITLHGSFLGPRFLGSKLSSLKILHDFIIATKLLQYTKKIITLCNKEKSDLISNFGIEKELISIIPNWVQDIAFEEHDASESVNNLLEKINGQYIVSLSRIDKNKRLELIIRALPALPEDVHYIMIGPDNGEVSSLLKLASELNVRWRVHYLGPIYGADKFIILRNSLALVLPSQFDFFPLAILEALAQGTPVLASPTGCVPDIVQPKHNGYFINTKEDIEKFILELYINSNLRRKLSHNARVTAEKFRFSRTYPKIKKLYEEVIESEARKQTAG